MFCFVASGSLVSRIIQVDRIWLWSCWSVILHKIYRTFLLRFSHFWNSTYSSRTAMNHNVMWHLYCSKIKIGFTAPRVWLDSPMVSCRCENFHSERFVKITANTKHGWNISKFIRTPFVSIYLEKFCIYIIKYHFMFLQASINQRKLK